MRQPDGATTGEHLEKVVKLTGNVPPQLVEAAEHPLPDALEYLWEWFCRMSEQRERTDKGAPKPLTAFDMRDWCALYAVRPQRWELQVLQQLERVFLQGAKRWMTSQS